MKASQIAAVISAALDDPENAPAFFIWGGPGIGKSSVMVQVTQKHKVGFLDLRALLLDPTDIRGIPFPENGKAKWLAPSFLPREGRGIVNYDELNRAPVLTQNSLLQLILDRRCGEYVMPPGWIQVACGNREMEAFVHRMDPALLNRFVHLDFDVDLDEWVRWAVSNSINPVVIGLLSHFRPTLLYQFDKAKKSFPTPRSWQFVSRVMSMPISEDMQAELIQGSVGQGAAVELQTYMKVWKELPNLDKILSGEDIIPKSVDIIYACIVGLVSKAKTQANYERLLKYSLKLDREFTMFMVKLLHAKDSDKVVRTKAWGDVSEVLVVEDKILS